MLKVNEIFLSIQGEGISTGFPTTFVRLTGCNLRCKYCDTTYSYNEGRDMSVSEVIEMIKAFGYKRVCITGGEPLLQGDLSNLLDELKEYEVSIETNGSMPIQKLYLHEKQRFTMDLKVPSSGEANAMLIDNLLYLREQDEIKIVIGDRNDYKWVREIIQNHYKKGIITFSPIYNKIDAKEIINWILEDKLDVRFQLQIHKIIWKPEQRGV